MLSSVLSFFIASQPLCPEMKDEPPAPEETLFAVSLPLPPP